MNTNEYFIQLEKDVRKVYAVAEEARRKGFDPVKKVEIPLAMSMAEKVVGLISTIYPQMENSKISERILDLEKQYGKLDTAVAFKIAEEVAKQEFCKFSSLLEAIDAGIRVGFAYITLGVVSSPIEGFTELKIGKTRNGKEYFIANFSGPIRSAGTTASCMALMLIDYLRELFGYEKYDPTEEEIKRYVTENIDYHERVTNLQYFPTEEEMAFLASKLPIQIAGEPTEKLEVSNYKNLQRVETNFIRGGMCLIFSEGLAQKAKKGLRLLNSVKEKGFKSTGWDYLKEYVELHEKRDKGEKDDSPTYIKDLVAGRPIFGHPSRSGGFRFRYGRGRTSGFSAVSLHPATMAVADRFIAIGTQLKIEKPTKGCAVTSCDSIDVPIVKLINGSVKRIKTEEEAEKLYPDIEEIIYLGDMLFPFSDLANRNANLIKPGYVDEWWNLELKQKTKEEIDYRNVSLETAIELSKKFEIPLYPKFIFYWTQISKEQFSNLIKWLKNSAVADRKIILPYHQEAQKKFADGKRALELLGVEHKVTIENVVIEEDAGALFINLGIDLEFLEKGGSLKEINEERFNGEDILQIINFVSGFIIKDKAGEFIGARMGRPEKAKLRKLTGSPNVLFPVGREGGRLRSVQAAYENGKVTSSFPIYFCEICKRETIYPKCEICDLECKKMYYCHECKKKSFEKCEHKNQNFYNFPLDIKHYFENAREKLGFLKEEMPVLIKGIRGTSSEEHVIEHLEKGMLRALFDLQVNKDGTIRFDATELPLVAFKPKEISVSIEKLRELGYEIDMYGNELENEEQILELMPHDVILPSCSESMDEKADDVFIRVGNFVDELLKRFYKIEGFYNFRKKEDLIGQLGVCMAPHNCAGVICRFIGFSKTLGLLASPYMHAAIRRDCVFPSTNFVYMDNQGFIKNEKIGDYVESLIKEECKTEKIDSYGTLKINSDKTVYAIGLNPKTKKIKKKKIKYFIKGKPPEKWVKIRTSSGREQIMTSTHKFIYLDENNNLKSKKANKIRKGDRIALINNFDIANNKIKRVFLPKVLSDNVPSEKINEIRIICAKDFFKKLVKKIGKSNFVKLLDLDTRFKNLSDWYKLIPLGDIKKLVDKKIISWEDIPVSAHLRTIFNNKKWNLNLDIDENLMKILGYYSAEGYCRQTMTVSQICFRIMDKNQQKVLISAIKSFMGLKPNLGEEGTKITICNKLVYYLFKYYFKTGAKAYEKRVPDIVYNVPNDLVKVYLSAYFDGDGTIINKGHKKFFCFYSVNRELLDGVSLLGVKFGLFGRFSKTKERLPGRKVLERYKGLGKEPKKHILQHLVYSGVDFYKLSQILKPVNKRKSNLIKKININKCRTRSIKYNHKYFSLEEVGDVFVDIIKEVEFFKENINSYCFEVDWKNEEDKNVLWGEQIINARCDGDEMAIMLLGDVLLNFSREFLPSHRGGTQDAPLVLNAKIDAGEVDDQILDFEAVPGGEYPLELYQLAEQRKHSSEIKIENIKSILKKGQDPFINLGFTHDTDDFNAGVLCSSYKSLGTMQEKLQHQMELVEKIRAVDTSDTARLVIERHFIKDMRGNLRKFSNQNFRCVECNEILRRPPISGVCPNCRGKIIFTINEGGIKKYLDVALQLAETYNLSTYMKQNLELTKRFIDSIFGKELEKQETIEKWF